MATTRAYGTYRNGVKASKSPRKTVKAKPRRKAPRKTFPKQHKKPRQRTPEDNETEDEAPAKRPHRFKPGSKLSD